MIEEPRHESPPAATGHDLAPRKTRHGRVPKDCRGDRNKRKRGAAIRQLSTWGVKFAAAVLTLVLVTGCVRTSTPPRFADLGEVAPAHTPPIMTSAGMVSTDPGF